jgi:RNA recognition motif-containing protein
MLKIVFMNMYVSNLGFHVSEGDLRKLFEQFGEVSSAKVITDRETGRSRGFGFVEMGTDSEANEAMSKLNNKEIEGRAISVSVARDKAPKSGNSRNF